MFHPIRITLSFSAAVLALVHFTVWAAEKRVSQPKATASLSTQVEQMSATFAKGETLSYIALLNELPAGDGELRDPELEVDDLEDDLAVKEPGVGVEEVGDALQHPDAVGAAAGVKLRDLAL